MPKPSLLRIVKRWRRYEQREVESSYTQSPEVYTSCTERFREKTPSQSTIPFTSASPGLRRSPRAASAAACRAIESTARTGPTTRSSKSMTT